jgi:cyclohexa-1,5-dienecarbonyl-CoA hydratase
MTENSVSFEIQNGAATLTFNRPPLNVLNVPLLRQLEEALAELSMSADVRLLILRAEGKLFSAGVDVADHTPEKVGEMIPLFDRVCGALADFPVPTLAAVHGHALGGGCELVLCCDLAVMAESAKIGQPEIQLAAFAPIAAMRLQQMIGYRAAADMLFSGRSLAADEALRVGLVNAVVSAEQFNNWIQEKAAQLTGLSRVALSLTKRALQTGFRNWSESLPELERLYLQEGLTAFLEKRQPVWKHK